VSILTVNRRRVRRSWVRAAWPLRLTRPIGWLLAGLVVFVVLPLIGGAW